MPVTFKTQGHFSQSENTMKHCLVTGCSGFIGNRIAAALVSRGLPVRGLSRQKQAARDTAPVETVQGDLTRPATLQGCLHDIDTVFHAAGHAHSYAGNDDLHRITTVEGTRNLLAECRQHGIQRFVFISSVKAMAEPGDACLDETSTGTPDDSYGQSRLQAERLVLEYGQQTGMHVSILRPTLVYGPGCKGNLASLLRWIDKGWFPPLAENGNRRSMVDVRDVVEATLRAADRDSASGKTCILTDGEDYSTHRILTAMRRALGKSDPGVFVPPGLLHALARCGDGFETLFRRRALYNSAMHTRLLGSACYRSVETEPALGFHPRYRLEDALPDMVSAYRQGRREQR